MSRNPRSGKKTNLSQFGLLDIPDINDDDDNLDLSDDDFDLEAELAAISGGRAQKPKPKKPAPVPVANLDAMIAESLKDVPSDDEGSGDDDDPDLLNELQALSIDDDEAPAPPPRSSRPAPPPPGAPLSTDSSTISMLQDRITNYTVAEKNAKANGESSRARRFGRGLKTLQELLKQAKAGKPIKNDDIPPPVMVGKAGDHQDPIPENPQPPPPVEVASPPPEEPLIDFSAPEPSPPAPSPPSIPEPTSTGDDQRKRELQLILQRQSEFKAEALAAKKRGDKFLALGFLKVTKQFDTVVAAHNSGEVMNMDELPTVAMITAALEQERLQQDGVQNSAAPEPTEDTSGGGGGLIMAKTLGEGLHQRLEAFKKQEAKAKEEGNSSKARRMNRIIKQYADAIKRHEAGQPVAVDDLPAPAGYGPLPTAGGQASSPSTPRAPAPAAPAAPEPGAAPGAAQAARRDQVLALLFKRQMQFKEIALVHKKKGELDTALQYLRTAKRFDPLIEAARAGRPVDLSNLPSLPKAKPAKATSDSLPSSTAESSSIDEPSGSDWVEVSPLTGTSTDDAHSSLLNQLESQAKMAKEFMSHCKSMGHVAESKMYEKLYERVKEDLDIVRVATLNNRALPSFHYVTREFSVTQCNTDLGVNDLELTIVRGIAYNVSKDMDTYVRFEFPFPQEAPISDRTEVVKDSNNPEYNAVFPLAINRSSRPCLRVFKRHGIKLEVWSKGGWFRSDSLLGTVNVKLAPLQEAVTLHDSFPLIDGRRPVGGSLEIKLRVRTPLLQQEVKTTKHRWLVLDDV
ncbi:hypothetical protein B5X24_HaOG214986 [Helicoverpa armigera]|nr:hypothetical protein B5X24_HaOG214986 [Helicoverpa armigera]